MSKKILVCGAGGFIGYHLAKYLKEKGNFIVGVDLKYPEYSATTADKFIIGDLRNQTLCQDLFKNNSFDEIYQLAADMGGADYIFTGEHDADIMSNSAQININVLENIKYQKGVKIFFSSSACIYPTENQLDPNNPNCSEDSAHPANPDSEYGWEKLFSEHLYLSYSRNYGINVKIARFHNIFGPEGSWNNGREKAPAAICRKVVNSSGEIEIWGDGQQTRSFLYIDECLIGIEKLMDSDFSGPVNIGSEEMISINNLAQMIINISGKQISIKNISGPTGVRGRNSNNKLILEKLKWQPSLPLKTGIEKTYRWINKQVNQKSHI